MGDDALDATDRDIGAWSGDFDDEEGSLSCGMNVKTRRGEEMKELGDFTKEEIEEINRKIDNMSHEEMCRAWRFSPSGDPIFRNDLPFYDRFKKRFDALGGFTPEISKRIGW